MAAREAEVHGLDDVSVAREVDEEALEAVPQREHREERAGPACAPPDRIEHGEQDQRPDQVVDGGVMDDGTGHVRGRTVSRRDLCVDRDLVAEDEVGAMTEVVGDEDVADPADDDADDESRRGGVERDGDREALATQIAEAEGQAPDEPAEHRQPALPDGQHVAPRVELVEVAEDVEPACADDGPERAPGHGVVHLGPGDATGLGPPGHEVRPDEEAQRRPESVW